jgi:AcrR family transcriptional regulator
MKYSKSYNTWLETAYQIFAEKGPNNLTIKALAETCGLPRTNFYYYFIDKQELIDKIIELHFKTTTELFNTELKNRLYSIIPDLYVIAFDFKLGFQFAKQLFLNRENPLYNIAYKQSIALSSDLIVPKFKAFSKIDLPDESVKSIWFTVTDAWFSRVKFNDFSVDYLCDLYYEIMDTLEPLIKKNGN